MAKFVGLELKRMEKGQRQRTAENLTACLDGMMWAAANQVRMNNYKTHQSSWCKGSFIMHRLTQVNGQCERDPFGRKSAGKRPWRGGNGGAAAREDGRTPAGRHEEEDSAGHRAGRGVRGAEQEKYLIM